MICCCFFFRENASINPCNSMNRRRADFLLVWCEVGTMDLHWVFQVEKNTGKIKVRSTIKVT